MTRDTREGAPPKAARFDARNAQGYDDRVARAIPGYTALHDVIAAAAEALLPPDARILVVGAGTGAEILRLGTSHPGWSFLGLDPAEEMLAVARERIDGAEGGLSDRVTLRAAPLEDLIGDPPPPFDAALCVLVSHFLPDTSADHPGSKAALYGGMGALVKPGAPLFLADFLPSTSGDVLERTWVVWQRERGIPDDAIKRGLVHARTKIHPIGPERLGALLDGAGFAPPQRLFQALHVHGWMTFRKESP